MLAGWVFSRPLGSYPATAVMNTERRNYVLGILNGAFARMGASFLDPNLVVAAFVFQLTGSKLLVGLAATLRSLGLLAPQLYVSSLIEHLPEKKTAYIITSVFRLSMIALLVGAIWLAGAQDGPVAVGVFFVVFLLLQIGMGGARPSWMDLVGKTVHATRLGGFFAWRAVGGGTLALLSGFLIIQPIIESVEFPYNYMLLAAGSFLFFSIGWGLFMLVLEAPTRTPVRPRRLREVVNGGASMLRDEVNYRRLFLLRLFATVSLLGLTFYIPYGEERLGLLGLSGVFVGIFQLSRLLSSGLWGRVSNRRGNQACLVGAGLFFTAAPVLALVAAQLPQVFAWPVRIPNVLTVTLDLPLLLYLVALALASTAQQGYILAQNAYLIESAPDGRRPSYIAFLSTLSLPMAFIPLLAGVVVDHVAYGMDYLLVVVALTGLLTWRTAARLQNVRREKTLDNDAEADDRDYPETSKT
jgi:MFS family permease